MKQSAVLAMLIFSWSIAHVGDAVAVDIKLLEFDGGSLPSSEADIQFYTSTGEAEGTLYSVSGGLLRQRTADFSTGNAGYAFPNSSVTGGGLSSALSTVMEVQLEVLTLNTASPENSGGVFFQVFDGSNGYRVFFDASGVRLKNASGGDDFVPLNASQMRTYRIESPANSNEVRLFVDGLLVHSGLAQSHSANGFNFGDGISSAGNSGDANWNFVRVRQGIPLTVEVRSTVRGIPTLSIWALGLLVFLLGFSGATARRWS